MAVLYITEYAETGITNRTTVAAAQEPPLATQTVAIGVSSVQSSAFNAATRLVRLHTDAICSVLMGTNPTAAATSPRMAANSTEYFTVEPGRGLKVAVITNT